MQELETLLNTLIARGRKPFNLSVTKCEIADHWIYFYEWECSVEFCSYRELVSLESGLWQFVCDNKFIKNTEALPDTICGWYIDWDIWYETIANQGNYEFRLLESALMPEEELGKFLVDNIKIDEH